MRTERPYRTPLLGDPQAYRTARLAVAIRVKPMHRSMSRPVDSIVSIRCLLWPLDGDAREELDDRERPRRRIEPSTVPACEDVGLAMRK